MSEVRILAFGKAGFDGELVISREEFDFLLNFLNVMDLFQWQKVLDYYRIIGQESGDPIIERLLRVLSADYHETDVVSVLAFDRKIWERDRAFMENRISPEFVRFMDDILEKERLVVLGYEFIGKKDEFTIRGRILDSNLKPIPYLRIKAYDIDRMAPDNLLGISFTDTNGMFTVTFPQEKYQNMRWDELRPKIVVQDWDPNRMKFKRIKTFRKTRPGKIKESVTFILNPDWKC